MTTTTLRALSAGCRITSTYGASLPRDQRDDWQRNANDYRCTLRYKGRRYSFDFFMGPALTEEPTVMGVLDCLLSDAQTGEQTFEEFCSDLGYDTDSRAAERTWKQCRKVAANMRRLLGPDFETFLYADRNDD